MNQQELDEKIAEMEMRWKQSIGVTKEAYKVICDELYAEKKVVEEAARRMKHHLN